MNNPNCIISAYLGTSNHIAHQLFFFIVSQVGINKSSRVSTHVSKRGENLPSTPVSETGYVKGSHLDIDCSQEQQELFFTRFENGYNIYTNAEYVTWLKCNHPDSIPGDLDFNDPSSKDDNNWLIDGSGMEGMDVFRSDNSDPYDPFEGVPMETIPAQEDPVTSTSVLN